MIIQMKVHYINNNNDIQICTNIDSHSNTDKNDRNDNIAKHTHTYIYIYICIYVYKTEY